MGTHDTPHRMTPFRTPLRRCGLVLLGLLLATSPATAQQVDPATRLAGRLPTDVEIAVLERIETARARSLPEGSLADLALQGVAKGRSAEEVLAALDQHLGALTTAREALGGPDAAVPASEVEAASLALRMGVDAGAVRELARSRPDGRSLEIPLLVLGGLSQRGLPSDQALGRILDRLAARADDAAFLQALPAGIGGPPLETPARPQGIGGGAAGLSGPPPVLPAPVGPAGSRRPDAPPGGGPPNVPGGGGTPNPGG